MALLNLCLVGECALTPGRPDPLKGVYGMSDDNYQSLGTRLWQPFELGPLVVN